jgi:hypothetical protein
MSPATAPLGCGRSGWRRAATGPRRRWPGAKPPSRSATTTTDIEILPRTPENLGLLVPPVPAGYALVDQLALDEVRAAGCVG